MKSCLALTLALVVWASPARADTHLQVQAQALGLRGALKYALAHSPTYDSAHKLLEVRKREYQNTIAKMLPSLDLSATNGLENNLSIGATNGLLTGNPTAPWYSSLNLGMTESLYDNGASITQSQSARLAREVASLGEGQSRDSVALQVAGAFYDFSLDSVLLKTKERQKEILDEQFRSVSSAYHQGLKTRSDYLRLQSEVERAEIDRLSAENDVANAQSELRKFLGVPPDDPHPPSFTPEEIRENGTAQIPTIPPVIEGTYEFKIAHLQSEIDAKNIDLARRQYWPSFDLSAGISYSNVDYLNSGQPLGTNDQVSWNVLLALQYNFWDWGTRRRNVEIAAYNRDIQQDTLNQSVLDASSQIAETMSDLARISRSFRLNSELLEIEKRSFADVESNYRSGKISYLDLITSLENLLDAKVRYTTAYFDALKSLARYHYYEGGLYEALTGQK